MSAEAAAPVIASTPHPERVGPTQPAVEPVGTLLSVNVGLPKDVSWQGRTVFTGVFKESVPGPRRVGRLSPSRPGRADRPY